MTPNEKAYCQLAIEYQRTDDPQSAKAIDAMMREMEENDPLIAALAEDKTDDELEEMLEKEGYYA